MHRFASLTLGLLLAAALFAAPQQDKTRKESALRCTLTNKVAETCCCQQRDGKLYCPLAKKTIASCCCVSAEQKPSKQAGKK